MLIPFATRPAQPMYCRFTPAVEDALLLLARLVQRPDRHPPAARPAGRRVQPGRRVLPDLAHRRGLVPRGPVQQPLRLAGDRSPACSPIVQPFRDGRSLASAFMYFPACSHVCVRAKHDRSSPIRADLSRSARRAPILAAAAALSSFVSTST